jgi:CMP-N-acetylneuraminic acid synthetase
MEILGIILARGGSKGLPEKNIALLNNVPLIAYTIKAAHESKLITRCILTSDSEAIISVAKQYDLEVPFTRPAELATDTTPALPVIQHAVEWLREHENYRPDYIVLLQPTSPLRTVQHIDQALRRLIQSAADSIVSVVKVPHNFNPYSVMELENGLLRPFIEYDEKRNLRQLKPTFYGRNGAAIYAFSYGCLMQKNSLYGDTILPFEMRKEDSIDIDDAFDLKICEFLLCHSQKNLTNQ